MFLSSDQIELIVSVVSNARCYRNIFKRDTLTAHDVLCSIETIFGRRLNIYPRYVNIQSARKTEDVEEPKEDKISMTTKDRKGHNLLKNILFNRNIINELYPSRSRSGDVMVPNNAPVIEVSLKSRDCWISPINEEPKFYATKLNSEENESTYWSPCNELAKAFTMMSLDHNQAEETILQICDGNLSSMKHVQDSIRSFSNIRLLGDAVVMCQRIVLNSIKRLQQITDEVTQEINVERKDVNELLKKIMRLIQILQKRVCNQMNDQDIPERVSINDIILNTYREITVGKSLMGLID